MVTRSIKVNAKVVPPGTVIIGAKIIDKLLANKQAKEQFGFLQNPPTRTYAACCGRTVKQTDYEAIKSAIAQLDTPRLEQLKAFIGAKHVQLWYRCGAHTRKKLG